MNRRIFVKAYIYKTFLEYLSEMQKFVGSRE
jgi:hypothetical protein